MAEKNRIKDGACILSDEQEIQLYILLEQINGCVELLFSRLNVSADIAAITALNVIQEKSIAAAEIVSAGCCLAPSAR